MLVANYIRDLHLPFSFQEVARGLKKEINFLSEIVFIYIFFNQLGSLV